MSICSATSGSTNRHIATVKEVFSAIASGELVFMGSNVAAALMERQLETAYLHGRCHSLYALKGFGNGYYKPYRVA